MTNTRTTLLLFFDALLEHFGTRNWWPGDTPLEIAIGAILTQNTSWKNVEKAISNLKSRNAIDLQQLQELNDHELFELIRPSGFFRNKTKTLRAFTEAVLAEGVREIEELALKDTEDLRSILLRIKGIGPETADSILLYALNKPVFVIDSYTMRFLRNHGIRVKPDTYDGIQSFFMTHLPANVELFNEYHALIVILGQRYCRRQPLCQACPLGPLRA